MADIDHNIDLLFRNGLKDYEVLPPQDLWQNVSNTIPPRKRKTHIGFLRAAAILLLFAGTGALAYLADRFISTKIGNLPAITLNQEIWPEGRYVEKMRNKNHIEGKIDKNAPEINIPFTGQAELIPIPDMTQADLPENDVQYINQGGNIVSGFIEPQISSPTDVKSQKSYEIKGKKQESLFGRRMSIGATLAPSYYSKYSTGNNEVINEYLNNENAMLSYSGGLSFAFGVSKRLSIKTGLLYSSIGQRIEGISSYKGFLNFTDTKSSSDFTVKTSYGAIASTNKDVYLLEVGSGSRLLTLYGADIFDPVKANLNYLSASLIQSINYFEIPILLKYKLIDRKLDINVVGGISYNMLIGNSTYISSGGVKYIIGKTEGLSPVTFSSDIGMGMEYKLAGKLTFNIEPIVRYYFLPMGGIPEYKIYPYSFGVLSGIYYNF